MLITALLIVNCATAINRDSLNHVFFHATDPNDRLHAGLRISQLIIHNNLDSATILIEAAAGFDNEANPVRRADYHSARGFYFWYKGDAQKAIDNFKVVMRLGQGNPRFRSRMAMAANNIGTLYSDLWQHDSTRTYLNIALQIDTELGNKRGMNKTMYDLGRLHLRLDQYELAMRFLLEAASYQQAEKDTFRLMHTLGLLGNAYARLDSTEKALEARLKVAELAEATNNRRKLTQAYNNLASMYSGKADTWETAVSYAKQGLVIAEEDQYHYLILALITNTAMAYMTGGFPHEALQHFNRATELIPMVQNKSAIARLYIQLGNLYISLNQNDPARKYLNKAIDITSSFGSLSFQSDAYFSLAKLDSIEGNYAQSLAAFRKGYALRDSLWNNEHKSRIAELQIIHDTERKLFEIEELKKKQTLARLNFYLSLLIIFIIAMALVVTLLLYSKKRKIDKQKLLLFEKEVEKTQLLLAANNQELTGKAFSLVKSEQVIQKLKQEIEQMIIKTESNTANDLKPLLKLLKTNDRDQQLWKDFENRFNELNDGFINKLIESYPDLSPAEIRLCAMLRLNLSSKEISEITSRSTRTIETTRSNIRKKMGLSTSDNLVSHLLLI